MLKSLLIGAASGYALKLIQVVCNLILIPFLIADKVLGLSGYGSLAVILAALGLITSALDGWRLTTARRFGLAKRDGEGVYLALLSLSLFPLLLVALIMTAFDVWFIELLGLANVSSAIIPILIAYFIFEQINVLSEQCLHANEKTWLVNLTLIFEVVLRTSALFLILSSEPSLKRYFEITVAFMAAKCLFYTPLLIKGGYFGSFGTSSVKYEVNTMLESLPLSLKSLSVFIVFRATVIVVNRLFSPEVAAIYSILMVTIRGYVTQFFVSVIRPMIVPMTAGINIKELKQSQQGFIISALGSYNSVVLITCTILAVLVPWWLPLWLGIDVSAYMPLFMVGIMVLGLEASSAVKNLLLVSQGHGLALTKVTVILAVIYLVYLTLAFYLFDPLTLMTLLSGILAFVFILAGLFIPVLFNRKVIVSRANTIAKHLAYFAISIGWAMVLNYYMLYSLYILTLSGVALALTYTFWIYNPLTDEVVKSKLSRLVRR